MEGFEGYSPFEAAQFVAKLIGLDSEQKEAVWKELDSTDEDPMLVIRLNQTWVNTFGEAAANQVLDAIATWRMNENGGRRRDDGAPRLCFHFADTHQRVQCHDWLIGNAAFADAFAPTPNMLAHLAAHNFNYPGNCEPMGFCAVVNKIAVRLDDVGPIEFFYR